MTTPTTRTLGRDDWTTPPEVFDPVNELVRFDLDACATDASVARLPQFISPEEDALTVKWSERGSRVWCNPPYGRGIKHWFAKAATEARDLKQLVLLVYANTDTAYWHEHVAGCMEVEAVVFIKPRVKFILPGMDTRAGAPKGSALVFYSRHAAGPMKHYYWDYKVESLADVMS
jgi:phage N-6-adenine-methyltransferase